MIVNKIQGPQNDFKQSSGPQIDCKQNSGSSK